MFTPKVSLEVHEREMAELRGQLETLAEPNDWLHLVLKKRITVHTQDSNSIDGTLMESMDDGVVLRAAKWLNSGGPPTSMAGEVWIPRENIAFVQLDE